MFKRKKGKQAMKQACLNRQKKNINKDLSSEYWDYLEDTGDARKLGL